MTGARRPELLPESADADLDRYGFARIDLLDQAETRALTAMYSELGPAPDDPRSAIHFGFFSADVEWKRTVDTRIRELVSPAIDRNFRGHECFFAMTIVKWPGQRGSFNAHQDPSYVDERFDRTLTVWCPLVPTQCREGTENGRLHLVPGSHRLGPDIRVNDTTEFAFEASRDEIVTELGVAVPTEPGQAVVFDNRTIHYSYPNWSAAPRVVVALGLRPLGTRSFHYHRSRLDDGVVDIFELPSDHFVRTNPLRLGVLGAEASPIASIRHAAPAIPSDELRSMVDSAGLPDVAVEPDRSLQIGSEGYCFVCGSTEALAGDAGPDQAGTAVCIDCVTSLLTPQHEDSSPTAEPLPAAVPAAGPTRKRRARESSVLAKLARRARARWPRGRKG